MEDLAGKVENGGATSDGILTSAEWNQLPTEVQNVITSAGISLSAGDTTQLRQAIALYTANGDFFTDSGIADAYILSQVSGYSVPGAYVDGWTALFKPANINTGASTVKIGALAVKAIVNQSGVALSAGDLPTGGIAQITFDLGNDRFVLTTFIAATTTQQGIVELATDAETTTGTDTSRVLTPSNLTSQLAANGGKIPETDNENIFTEEQFIRKVANAFLELEATGSTLDKKRVRLESDSDKFRIHAIDDAGSIVNTIDYTRSGGAFVSMDMPAGVVLNVLDAIIAGTTSDEGAGTVNAENGCHNDGVICLDDDDRASNGGDVIEETAASLTGTSGFIHFSNGWIVQWGQLLIAPGAPDQAISFPIVFPTATRRVVTGYEDSPPIGASSPSAMFTITTSGGILRNGSSTTELVVYIALGH